MPKISRYKHEDYTTISVPREILERIDKVITDKELSYISTSEFVRDAIRRLLDEIEEKEKHNKWP